MAVYCTTSELRAQIDKTSAADDAVLDIIIQAASRAIDNFCKRPDGFIADTVASIRTYSGDGGPILWIDECTSITLVAEKDSATATTYTAWAAADWDAFAGDPNNPNWNPIVQRKPYEAIMVSAVGDESHFLSGLYTSRAGFRPSHGVRRKVPTVQVTATWGYATTVPYEIKQACIVQSSRWFKQGQSAHADTMARGEFGLLLYNKPLAPAVINILVEGGLVKKSRSLG